MGVLEQVLPVGTLVLGAGLTHLSGISGSRRATRAGVRELLAEHPKFVFEKGGERDWTNLLVYLGRLRGQLQGAGVPAEMRTEVENAMRETWQALYDTEEPETGWVLLSDEMVALDESVARVERYLDDSWRVRRTALKS